MNSLAQRIADAGLNRRRPGYYAARIATIVAAFIAAWVVFFVVGNSWWQLGVAALIAVTGTQLALVAHDLAHRQVFRRRRAAGIAGRLAGNLGVGMSYGWWQDKHTRHHAHPNHEERDPDVAPDILVWSDRQARASGGVARFLGRHQARWFYPLLTLEGWNLHVSSIRALFRRDLPARRTEAALLAVHAVAYVGAVALVLPLGKALAFVALHKALSGLYLGSVFAPNHKGMRMLADGEELDPIRRQVLTSRNVRGNRFIDAAMGGLNYQIEHHLFPTMPSPHLPKARPIVRQYCAEHGIDYHETGLFESYAEALRHMHRIGRPLRNQPVEQEAAVTPDIVRHPASATTR